MRALVVVALAAGLALALAGGADARSCGKRAVKVRVHGHQRCVKAATLRSAAGRPAAVRRRLVALVGDGTALPRARSTRIRRADRRLRAARRRLLARGARAAGTEPVITSETEQPPDGQLGRGGSVTGTQTISLLGQPVDMTLGMGEEQFAEACPRVGGDVPGRSAMHWAMAASGPLSSRLTLTESVRAEGKAKLSGHVGSDGRLRDYDMAVDIEFAVRRTVRGPAGLVHGDSDAVRLHVRAVFLGLEPGAPAREWLDAAHMSAVNVLSLLKPLESGAAGPQLSREDATALVTIVQFLKRDADAAMERAQKHYYDDAACLTAEFVPDPLPRLKPGESRGATVAVRSTVDSKPQSIDLDVTGTDGVSVSSLHVHAAPSTPARLTLRAPAREGRGGLKVDGTSVRGRVIGSRSVQIEDPVLAWGYAVRLTGSGSYSEDVGYADATTDVNHRYRTTFSFDDRWARLVLPTDRSASRQPFAMSSGGTVGGTATSEGSRRDDINGDSDYRCSAPLSDGNAQPGILSLTLNPGIVPGGARIFTIRAVSTLAVAPGAGGCTTSGSGFTGIAPAPGGVGVIDLAAALQDTGIIQPGLIGRTSFSVPIESTPIPAACTAGNGGGRTCTHAVAWTGTATFTRVERCTPAAVGYACTRG